MSRQTIARSAVRVIDEEGFAALTMRRVAGDLGAGTMSLYSYVSGRDELVRLAVDEMLSAISLPDERSPWREQVEQICYAYRATVRRHRILTQPSVITSSFAAAQPGPKANRLWEQLVGALRTAGFPEGEANTAATVLGAVMSIPFVEAGDPSKRTARGEGRRAEPHRPFAQVALPEASFDLPDEGDLLFEPALRLVIDSFASSLRRRRPAAGRPGASKR